MTALTLDDMIQLQHLATVGKLVNGLIHNLSGPLQNIGMDIELMEMTLPNEQRGREELVGDTIQRLKRIGEEVDQMAHFIKNTSMRTGTRDETQDLLGVNHLLEQELVFLESNLYFKHQVQADLKTEGELPRVCDLPRGAAQALGWFIQAIAEAMEIAGTKRLSLEVKMLPPTLHIIFSSDGSAFASSFTAQLNLDRDIADILGADGLNAGEKVTLAALKTCGGSLLFEEAPSGSRVTLTLPIVTP
jgi:C4-dicarboxylate-specific signal transduction histidine kinase